MSGEKVKVVYIKKKGKEGGHHGGAWKVAYADFVTAMMALFIVLWLLTQTDAPSKERIAQYFRTGILPGGSLVHGKTSGSNPAMAINIFPTAPPPRSQTSTGEGKSLAKLTTEVQKMLGTIIKDKELEQLREHVNAKIVDEGALIELVDGGDSFLFSVASSDLKPGAIAFLKRLAPLLAAVPNKVEIHGHTDARRFDKQATQDNWDLSFERANQARSVLEANGLPKGRVSAVLAHADSAPYNAKDSFAPENRRLAILVVREGYEAERQGKVPAQAGPGTLVPKPADKSAPTGELKGEPPSGKLVLEKTKSQQASPEQAKPEKTSPEVKPAAARPDRVNRSAAGKAAAEPQPPKRPVTTKPSKKPAQP